MIEVIGLGHIGLVMLASLSNTHDVVGIDNNPKRIAELLDGIKIFHEDDVFECLKRNKSRIIFKDKLEPYKNYKDTISFICVGTPYDKKTGGLSVSGIENLIKELALRDRVCNSQKIYCIRSTVYPGTIENFKRLYLSFGGSRNTLWYYLPEFLREGTAYQDYTKPNIYILGRDDPKFDAFVLNHLPKCTNVIKMPLKDSEVIKLVFNSWHAVKISFANELGFVCKSLGLNHDIVVDAFLADKKLNISEKYLKPGFAFGGYCLPKDSMAFGSLTKSIGFKKSIVHSAIEFNDEVVQRWSNHLTATIDKSKKVLFVGIAFKKGCGDIRESNYLNLLSKLLKFGLNIQVFDPYSLEENPNLQNQFNFVKSVNNIKNFDIIIKSYEIIEIASKISHFKKDSIINLDNLC
jgi:GDP-mannose 6-dehydrogenase